LSLDRRRRGASRQRIRHAHHAIGHAVRFALERIVGRADRQLRLSAKGHGPPERIDRKTISTGIHGRTVCAYGRLRRRRRFRCRFHAWSAIVIG